MSFLLLAAAEICGVFPLLCTPYAESGALDVETLAKEARFVADCGANGVIWPAADDALKLLTPDEERRGWEAITGALKDRDVWFCPCCPGTNVTDQLRRLRDAEAAWRAGRPGVGPYRERFVSDGRGRSPSAPRLTALVRMVNDANDDAAYRAQYETVAAAFTHPIIIQTYNGKSPMPSMKLMIDLARRFPKTYGWFKVEGSEKIISERMSELVAAKPVVKTVFTGWGGRDWLYQYRRIGTRGVISQRPMYADLMVKAWRALEADDPCADELFAKFMYLRNLDNVLPSANMRGWNLYVLKKRGIFPNTLSREAKKGGGWELKDLKLTDAMKSEIDRRIDYALGDTRAARGSAPTANAPMAGGDPVGGDPRAPRSGTSVGGDPRAPRIIAPRTDAQPAKPWKPIGNRRARVVHWGIVHNHSQGKWDAVLKLTNDFEMVGWVDDSSSTAMRMQEPKPKYYSKYPRLTPRQVFDEVKPDLIVVECSNEELVQVSTEIARHGIPMHMDKPLGTDPVGFRKMSGICEAQGVPLQIGYMFRSNEAINKMVELAKNGTLGEIYSVEADLDHNYGYPKYPEYASHYPGGTAYLLACHAIEWAMPIFNDEMPLRTHSIIKPAPGDPEWAKTHSLTVMEYPRANCVFRVCAKGTQPCRHIRIDGTHGSMELEPIEDFRTVKHTTGLNEGLAKVDKLEIKLFLKKVNDQAKKAGYHDGINRIVFKAPSDRYAGQLHELARIIRGEIPNPPGLYEHDLKVHRVSLDACNL